MRLVQKLAYSVSSVPAGMTTRSRATASIRARMTAAMCSRSRSEESITVFWLPQAVSQPTRSTATTMAASHGSSATLPMSSGGCGPAAWKAPTAMMTPIQPIPADTKAASSHCQPHTTRHQVGIRPPTGMLSLIAARSAALTSPARDRAAARTVRGQGSGRVPPAASAKAVTAVSISDCWASAPALSATRASPLTRPRRTGSRPGNQPAARPNGQLR